VAGCRSLHIPVRLVTLAAAAAERLKLPGRQDFKGHCEDSATAIATCSNILSFAFKVRSLLLPGFQDPSKCVLSLCTTYYIARTSSSATEVQQLKQLLVRHAPGFPEA
jgi:hypothetical protein